MQWTTSSPGFPIDREVHCSTVPCEVFKGAEYPSCMWLRWGFMVDFRVEYGLQQGFRAKFKGF